MGSASYHSSAGAGAARTCCNIARCWSSPIPVLSLAAAPTNSVLFYRQEFKGCSSLCSFPLAISLVHWLIWLKHLSTLERI